MTPKIVDKEQRRLEIALAALEVFAREGFETTSISQIAKAIGIGKGTVYEYFPSKEALIGAAARAWVASLEAGISPHLDATLDPEAQLRSLFEATTRSFLEAPHLVRLFLEVLQVGLRNPALQSQLGGPREISRPVRDAIEAILRRGVEQGVFLPEVVARAPALAINMVAFVDGLGMHYIASPGFFDLHAQVDLYLEGVLSGLRTPSR